MYIPSNIFHQKKAVKCSSPGAYEGREVVVQGRPLALRQHRLRQVRSGAKVGGGPAAAGVLLPMVWI